MNARVVSAVEAGNLDELRRLIDEEGGDVNATRASRAYGVPGLTEVEEPVMVVAASQGHFEMVEFLLERGANVQNSTTTPTVLHHVVSEGGSIALVKRLIEAGCDVNAVEARYGYTPLFHALHDTNILQTLIDMGANCDSMTKLGDTPLKHAAASNCIDEVKALMSAGADVNHPCSPIIAVKHLPTLKLFMEAGADIDAQSPDKAKITLLFQAVEYGRHDVAMELIQAGAETNVRDPNRGQTILTIACGSRQVNDQANLQLVKALVETGGADVNFIGLHTTPLIEAARLGHLEVLTFLMKNGADVNACIENKTAFLQAKDEQIATALFDAGADVSVGVDPQGRTPLINSVRKGWCKMTPIIIKKLQQQHDNKAFLNDKDAQGDAPMHISCRKANQELLDLLIEAGADPNTVNSRTGETPLHIAVQQENTNMVLSLVNAQADTSILNRDGASALFLANSPKVRRTLGQSGAPCILPVKFKGGGFFPMANPEREFEEGEIPRSLVELGIMGMAGAIRDKTAWWVKITDEELIHKWRQEVAGGYSLDGSTDGELAEELQRQQKQFDFAVEECKWMASRFQNWPSRPAAVDNVFCRDDLDTNLRQELLTQIALLRSRPAIGTKQEDRHPGTPQMVDLIHPSMYCYEEGKTHVLKGIGANAVEAPEWEDFLGTSGHAEELKGAPKPILQWLPSEFFVHPKDFGHHECRIKSYINSLHPLEFPSLYSSISQLFVHTLPLLEDVLAEVVLPSAFGPYGGVRERKLRVPIDDDWWEEGRDDDDGETEDDDPERTFIPQDIPTFKGVEYTAERVEVTLLNRPLQVIVKVVSLELKEHERYNGGTWHIEGTPSEQIVATACCYLESVNVTGGDLGFRTAVAEPEQGDHEGIENTYGLVNEEPLVQPRGECSTVTGRVLAWPNTLQHCVRPVELEDREKPGKQTICCFFLVDPTVRVRSTATVPPQQKAWMADTTETLLKSLVAEPAVRQKIASEHFDSTHFLTYEQACERRERLMGERSMDSDDDEEGFERNLLLL